MSQLENHTIIVYDLGSENMSIFRSENVKKLVRTTRVRSVQLLHSLGLQCTESVIIVAENRVSDIENVIVAVHYLYARLNNVLRNRGINVELKPIIEVLNLTPQQTSRLIPLAERRLISSLDNAIETVSDIINILSSEVEEERKKRIRNNLRRLAGNWRRIYQMANSLRINITKDYEFLVTLIEQALERCQI